MILKPKVVCTPSRHIQELGIQPVLYSGSNDPLVKLTDKSLAFLPATLHNSSVGKGLEEGKEE